MVDGNDNPVAGNGGSFAGRNDYSDHGPGEERIVIRQSGERNRDRRSTGDDEHFRGRRDQRNQRGYNTEQPPPTSSASSSSSSRWGNRRSTTNQYYGRDDPGETRYNDDNDGPRRATPAEIDRNGHRDANRNSRDDSGKSDGHSFHSRRDRTYSDSYRNDTKDRRYNREFDRGDDYRKDDHYRGRGSDEDDFHRRESMREGRGRDNRYNDDRGRGHSRGNDHRDMEKYGNDRTRSDSDYSSDEYNRSHPSERSRSENRRRSRSRRFDRRRFGSRDDNNSDYYGRGEDDDNFEEKDGDIKQQEKPKEWPPSFQDDGSAFSFDTRSAMFYEPLSDFFYDPKSKLYYGNKKCAYFRYDDAEDPPFVEVKKLTMKEVEEQQGDGGGISQEKLAVNNPASAVPSKPKIAIKLKTKKVKSSSSTKAAIQASNQATASTVSKAKQQQIANIGKWTEKQAELKQDISADSEPSGSSTQIGSQNPQPKVRTTLKGEPICVLCKRKFPTLEKLRLHEKASDLHKKNLLKLQEKKKMQQTYPGAKRKLEEDGTSTTPQQDAVATSTAPVYTDRAQKRRQLHGTDMCVTVNGLASLQRQNERPEVPLESLQTSTNAPGSDLLDETNVGHKLLQKLGYKAQPSTDTDTTESTKPKTANEHLRKEWDRIEAMAAKSQSRYHPK